MSKSEQRSPMAHLARWRGVLVTWTVVQFAASLFGTPIRFQVGVLAPLFSAAWFYGGLAMLAVSIVMAFLRRAWGAAVIPAAIVILLALSLLAYEPLDLLGDRLVFETLAPRYGAAIAKLQAGEPETRACAEFRHGCGVSRREGLRVAFYHPEFYDKFLGYVYDPSGVYGRLDALSVEERETLTGELVPGAPVSCRPLRGPYYRCFFS